MIYRYPHPEYFCDWDKPVFENLNKPLVLWGAAKIGGIAAHCLKKRGVEFAAFCDIASDKWGTQFCGHEIISPDELQQRYPNAIILISAVVYTNVYSMASARGYQEIYDCAFLFMEIDFSDYDFWTNQEYAIRNVEQYLAGVLEQKTGQGVVDQIYLNITNKCTLRCKECSAFIPYVTSPQNYKSDDILSDLEKVLDCLGHVRIVNFYGGEPMLHPELARMIKALKNETRVDRISIVTNGTVVPNEAVLQAMKEESRFLVRLSDYGAISKNLLEITKALEYYGVKYEITNYAYWDSVNKIGPVNETETQLAKKFRMCTSCNILFLSNRKGYLCSTTCVLCDMNAFPMSARNYIDLQVGDNLSEKLKTFLTRPIRGEYLDACQYCSGVHCIHFEKKLPVAEQTKELLTFPKLT